LGQEARLRHPKESISAQHATVNKCTLSDNWPPDTTITAISNPVEIVVEAAVPQH